jgi:hypothetical protein
VGAQPKTSWGLAIDYWGLAIDYWGLAPHYNGLARLNLARFTKFSIFAKKDGRSPIKNVTFCLTCFFS